MDTSVESRLKLIEVEEKQNDLTKSKMSKIERRWPQGWKNEIRYRILYFSPVWWTANMATGATSVLLHNLPYQFTGLNILSIIVFILNIFMFIVFLVATISRYILYPQLWKVLWDHPVQSLYVGTFSMGLSTIVTAGIYICTPYYGLNFVYFLWAVWWLVISLAISTTIGIPYLMFTRHVQVDPLSSIYLNPIVAPIISAACGSVVASALPAREALVTIVLCYLLLGLSVPATLWVMALYYQRLIVHRLPPNNMIITIFLPIGPCGQTAFSLIKLSNVLRRLLAEKALSSNLYTDAEIAIGVGAIHFISLLIGIFMIGLGMFWLLISVVATLDTSIREGIPLGTLQWWGIIFPISTIATSTLLVYEDLDFLPFKTGSMILSSSVILIWLGVFMRSSYEVYTGRIFVDACIPISGEPPPRKRRKDDNKV